MKRKVLMISHGYPPVGGSGMLRTLKFSRYLPEHGWQPLILTLKRTKHPRLDPKLLAEVPPGTPVYHSPVWNALAAIVACRKVVKRVLGGGGAGAGDATESTGGSTVEETGGGGLARKVKDFFTTPDGYVGWYLPGLLIGLWMIIRHRPRVIYSTSPPPTAHLIGRALSRMTGIPWVIDFRDPWTLQFPAGLLTTRKGRICRKLERDIMSRTQRVIANTVPLAAALKGAYPDLPDDKVEVITNGFDPADFVDDLASPPADGPFMFLHAGEFFPAQELRVPDPFLIAVRDLLEEGLLAPDSVRVRLVGSGEYTTMPAFRELMKSAALSRCVEVIDFVPHGEIPAHLEAAHALLLFQNSPHFRMQVPAKTFEYIRAGRPILTVSAPGATPDLVRSVKGGYAVAPEDQGGLRRAILEIVELPRQTLRRRPEELDRFSRAGLTRRLAGLLDGMIGLDQRSAKGTVLD
ncbi:MAG: glycosyltransferase family 4 protein [bacterium]|nr:glycosyltransferase family 4 protein [bacterium]